MGSRRLLAACRYGGLRRKHGLGQGSQGLTLLGEDLQAGLRMHTSGSPRTLHCEGVLQKGRVRWGPLVLTK